MNTTKPKPYTQIESRQCRPLDGVGGDVAVDLCRFFTTVDALTQIRAALEALAAGVEDRCELYRRCDIAACNCGYNHLTALGERLFQARRALEKFTGS